jgi:hypothetical protein
VTWIGWVVLSTLVIGIGIVVWGIRDVLSYPPAAFEAARRNRSHWVIVQIVLGPVATFAWVATARFDVRDPSRLDDEMLLTDDMPRPW